MAGKFLYLSEETLLGLGVTAREAVDRIEHLIKGRAAHGVWAPPKISAFPPDDRYIMATLAAADDPPYVAVKALVLNPANYDRGLPQINGTITLLDSSTGQLLAIVDGNWVTAVRTAALSAVAAGYMARPQSRTIAFIGCGVQANSHLQVFNELFPLTDVMVFGRGRKNIDALCRAARDLGLSAVDCGSAREAVDDADLVVTSVTHSTSLVPFLNAGDLKAGSYCAITDIAAPWIKETFASFDIIAVDDVEQEANSPRKLVDPELVAGDLSELVLGKLDGRTGTKDRTAFIFRALSIGDLALAALAYEKALARGLGTPVET